jgi:hypothetical protein
MRGRYDGDVLAESGQQRIAAIPEVAAELGLVVEDADTGWCGAIVEVGKDLVLLEDRFGKRRAFALHSAAFRYEGRLCGLVKPVRRAPPASSRTASGSTAAPIAPARVARASRLFVEGVQDAALVERIWGADLRACGIVTCVLCGVDVLPDVVREFQPSAGNRLGVLVDHLVPGSKEARVAAAVTSSHVLVTGHPFVDIWQGVKPTSVGIAAWPAVAKGVDWKTGVCAQLGWPDPATGWRRVLAGVRDFNDLETPLLRAVEQLIDFVTEPVEDSA